MLKISAWKMTYNAVQRLCNNTNSNGQSNDTKENVGPYTSSANLKLLESLLESKLPIKLMYAEIIMLTNNLKFCAYVYVSH